MPRPQPIVVPHAPVQNMKSFEGTVDLKQIFQAIKDIQEWQKGKKMQKALSDVPIQEEIKGSGMQPVDIGEGQLMYQNVPPKMQPRPTTNILDDILRIGGQYGDTNLIKTAVDAIKQLTVAPQAGKEFNIPGDLDSFLAGISGRYGVNYATSEGRMKMLQEYGKDQKLMKEFKEFKTSPYFAVVPTAEGLTLVDTRKGQKAGTIGEKPLTGEMITTEQQIGSIKTVLDDVRNLYKPEYVGPLAGRYGSLKEYTVGLPEEQASFNSKLASIQNSLIYLKSGKQINEQEYKRLLKQLPDKDLPPSTFEARMKGFEQEVESIIEERQKVSGGYGVPKRQTQPKSQPKETQKQPENLKEKSTEDLLKELYK